MRLRTTGVLELNVKSALMVLASTPGDVSLNDFYLAIGIIVGVTIIIAAMVALYKVVRKFTRRVGYFLDDWGGTEIRPGVPQRSGVMERLEDHGRQLGEVHQQIDRMGAELTSNGGGSIKDTIQRIDLRVEKIEKTVYPGKTDE